MAAHILSLIPFSGLSTQLQRLSCFTMSRIILLLVCLISTVASCSAASRLPNSWLLPTRQGAAFPNQLTNRNNAAFGCPFKVIHDVRGGASNSPPEDEEEEDEDEAEDDADEDEEASEVSSVADIEIKVPDEEEWNDKERAIEEAEADIEVMVEMEAEESEESDVNNEKPDAEEPATVNPVAVESTIITESAAPIDDGDSSAFVDRMELADAYDEGDSTTFENEAIATDAPPAVVLETTTEAASEPQPETSASAEPEQPETSSDVVKEEPAASVAEPEPVSTTAAATESEEPQASSEAAPSSSEPSADEQPSKVVQEAATAASAESVPAPDSITDAMKESLRQLGYRRDDIASMKPSIAAVVIAKKLNRPIEGLPENWYLADKKPRSGSKLAKVIAKIVLPILAAAVAVKGGMEMDLLSMVSPSSNADASTSVETFRPLTAADMAYYSSIISEATGKKTSPKRQ